jgi:hypothetical protein
MAARGLQVGPNTQPCPTLNLALDATDVVFQMHVFVRHSRNGNMSDGSPIARLQPRLVRLIATG